MKRLTNREAIEKIFKILTIVSTENKNKCKDWQHISIASEIRQ